LAQGARLVLPEIGDYKVRRELVRINVSASIARLDGLTLTLEYLPLTTAACGLLPRYGGKRGSQGSGRMFPSQD